MLCLGLPAMGVNSSSVTDCNENLAVIVTNPHTGPGTLPGSALSSNGSDDVGVDAPMCSAATGHVDVIGVMPGSKADCAGKGLKNGLAGSSKAL